MVLYCKLDQKSWAIGDYTDSATYDLSGTIYRDAILVAAETSLDTFSGSATELRILDINTDKLLYTTTSTSIWTLNSDGTFLIKFTATNRPTIPGATKLVWLFAKTGTLLTAIGVNGSNHLHIHAN